MLMRGSGLLQMELVFDQDFSLLSELHRALEGRREMRLRILG